MVGRLEEADREILGPRILVAKNGFEIAGVEFRILEGEQIDRAMAEADIALAVIEHGADREPVAIERYRTAEIVIDIKREVDVLAARIALADDRFEDRRCKIRPGEAEQIDRARIIGAVGSAIVEQRPDREPAGSERHDVPNRSPAPRFATSRLAGPE